MSPSIVCGVDGSSDSRAAVDVAAELANRLGARLVLAHVAELARDPHAAAGRVRMAGWITFAEAIEAQQDAAKRMLEQVAVEAGLVDAEYRVDIGHPAEQLAQLADEEHAELIVVGSRGRRPFKAALLGSVSQSLVGAARCPVLVVPPSVRNGEQRVA